MFEALFDDFWKRQVKEAEGQREEMLHRDLTGTKLLLEVVVLPVFGTLEGFVLEMEMVGQSGVKIFGDVVHPRLRIVIEEENYITHAEKVTRRRFSFERSRARSIATLDYAYFPFSRDDLDTQPEVCQKNLSEWVGRFGNVAELGINELSVYEREVMRFAMLRLSLFQLADACSWLRLKKETCRKVLRQLEAKELIVAVGGSQTRCHAFRITEKAWSLLERRNRG